MFVQIKELTELDNYVPELVYFVDRNALPSWRIPEHRIDFHDLTWVQAGQATYTCNGHRVEAKAGDLFYLPQGSLRAAHTNAHDPMHTFAINFTLISLHGSTESALPLPLHSTLGFPDYLADLYKRLNKVWLEKAAAYRTEARSILALIILFIVKNHLQSSTEPHSQQRMALIQDYILRNYAQPISLEDLAHLVHLNPVYCGAWFKATSGLTIKQYINRIRVRKAADLLSTGGFRVGEAANKCGFDDLFYFSKVFKRIQGYAPSSLIRDNTDF